MPAKDQINPSNSRRQEAVGCVLQPSRFSNSQASLADIAAYTRFWVSKAEINSRGLSKASEIELL